MHSPSSSFSAPLREIVIDRVAEKDAKMTIPQDVAQTSNVDDGNGLKKDGASNHCQQPKDKTIPCIVDNGANGKTTTTDTVDDELSLKLRDLLSFNKRGSVDTTTTIGAGSTTTSRLPAPQVGRRFSVDTGHFDQQDNEREHDEALSSYANIMRNHRQRSISLRSLGDAGVSTNLREQLHAGGRSASMRSLGRQPSLRRRHSICYAIPPSGSATTVSSEQSFSPNSTALSTPRAPDRRASMSCVDSRSLSLSSIITECHPLSVGIGNFSSDEESSDDDSSVGG